MALFGLLFLGVIFVMTGVGIVLGLAAVGAAAALVSVGVLSSSVLIGLRAGRSEAGIRALLIQCGLLAGIPAGAVLAWGLSHFVQHLQLGEGWVVPACGALGGAVAGLSVAFILDALSRRTHAWIARRLSLLPSPSSGRSGPAS